MADEIMNRHQGHAFAGIHGAKPLYTQLCANGYEEIAIAALKQPTWPSYANMLANGFTTWPEQMDEIIPDARIVGRSLNHPMQSGFAAWFHESAGGIRPAAPGFKRIELTPRGFTQIAWVKAKYDSLYGPIRSEWHSERGVFKWNIAIPANTTATVSVPAKARDNVTESGRPADTSRGMKFLRFEDGRAFYEVESGQYKIQSSL
jgi:alpha-L-rhamnosidase